MPVRVKDRIVRGSHFLHELSLNTWSQIPFLASNLIYYSFLEEMNNWNLAGKGETLGLNCTWKWESLDTRTTTFAPKQLLRWYYIPMYITTIWEIERRTKYIQNYKKSADVLIEMRKMRVLLHLLPQQSLMHSTRTHHALLYGQFARAKKRERRGKSEKFRDVSTLSRLSRQGEISSSLSRVHKQLIEFLSISLNSGWTRRAQSELRS